MDELIHNYDIRNTIEIEKKYHFSDEAVFQDVLAYLKTRDDVYSFDKSPAFEQVDSYYDTPDKLVESAKSTLRIRHKDCNYEITIKCPTPVQIKDNGQNERFEFCHPISSNSLSGEEAFIVKHEVSGRVLRVQGRKFRLPALYFLLFCAHMTCSMKLPMVSAASSCFCLVAWV